MAVQLRTFALAQYDVLIDVPASHDLAGSDGHWFVFGYLDGQPLVPDARIFFAAGVSMEEVISEVFPGSGVELVARCFVDEVHLVTSPGGSPDGAATTVEGYVLPVEGGVIVADRYEGFDWEYFDLVGRSLRTYRSVE